MSRLIDQLLASDFPDRSARDLTIEYGDWLDANKRQDVFSANPDFAKEYHALKDEINRARRPGYGEEFAGAFGSAVDELQSTGFALGALAAHGARALGVPGADGVRDNLLRLMKEQDDQAAEYRPSVASYDDISGAHPIEDTARYLTYGAGTVAPSIIESAAAALVGAGIGTLGGGAAGTAAAPGPGTVVGAIGGAAGGALLGLAERKLAQKAVSKLLERGIKTVTLEQAAKALPREAVAAEAKRLAVQYGSQAALTLSSVGQEVGSIYGDNPDAPGTALAFGVPAGLLDVLPETYVLSRFFSPGHIVADEAAEKATGYFRRFVTEAFKTVPLEATTESAQTLLEIAAAKYGRNEPVKFTDNDFKQAINAGIVGAIGGGAMAPVAATQDVRSRVDPRDALAGTVVERLPIGNAPEGGAPLEFGGEIPEADLIGRSSLGAGTRAAIATEEAVGREGFSAIDEAPYAAFGGGQPVGAPGALPAINLPPAVAKAVENADAAIARWGGVSIESAPEPVVEQPVASAEVTDAPLEALVGTQVEYTGYRGTLVRDHEGNFMVMPPVRDGGKPFWIEVSGTSKDPSTMATSVGLTPLEPARMDKAAPPVAIPQAPGTARAASKVPLGDLFPSDLVPRRDVNPTIFTEPGTVAAASARGPAPASVPAPSQIAAPAPVVAPPAPAAPAVAPAAVAPVEPVKRNPTALPTGEQVAAASGNGVPSLPKDSVPNMRRLRIFEQPKPAATEEGDEGLPPIARAKESVEAQSLAENPLVTLDKAVGKLGKSDSNIAAVIVDNATGASYVRGAYRGAGNVLYLDMASSRKGTATGKGSTVTAEADFLNGTEGRPAMKLFSEKLPNGLPRYSVYGVGELAKAGGLRNWNAGPAAELNTNPGIQEVARRWWTDEAKRTNGKTTKMPAAAADIEAFAEAMSAWRRDNPGTNAGVEMAKRVREHAAIAAKGYGLPAAKVDAWAAELSRSIEEISKVQAKQAVLLSYDYLATPQSAIDVMRTTLRALTEGRKVDVAAFEQQALAATNRAAKKTGMVIESTTGRKIVAFGLSSVRGPVDADTVLSVLHEAAHVATDGLSEPLRVAFQEAVEQMPWTQARWLMNPRSLDIRILANAEPAQLSPEQRTALERLTADEIAAARRIDRSALLEEQMAEHLAQLGWDRAEAKGVVQKVIRFIKDLWLRFAMAIQSSLKGADNVSPALARRYVENRFLQFIHRDSALSSDRINDLLTWVGVPPTERQLIPVFPAGADWDQRMQYVDVATGQLIPVDHATYTPDAQTSFLKTAIDNAARFLRENPNDADTPDFRQTRRAAFSAPLSFTPSLQTNTVFAAINLESQIYRTIAANPDIAPFLTPGDDFSRDWLRLPDAQVPSARRGEAETWAKAAVDPMTGAAVAYNVDISIDELPSADEPIVDREGKPVTVKLTEAQDKALQQTIASLNDTQSRLQRRINYEMDRIADLERIRKRNPADFPVAALKELDDLNESLPLRLKIAAQLTIQKNALVAKFQPGDLVNIFPTAEYLTVPGPEATEAQIRKSSKGVVPRDLKFTDKTTFAGHLAAMEAWLLHPDNRAKGQIYGIISEQYRKLVQLPTDLERAGTAALFRRAVTGSFVDELRASGLPALQNLAKKFFETASIINAHNDRVSVAGDHWSDAFAKFARAVGGEPDQAFKERVWDPLMRVWNFIDVSERNRIGTSEEGDLFTRMERALKTAAGVEVDSPAKRASLRALLMQTIENERQIRTVYEQNAGLKVRDEEMGIYRRLVSHGLVTGRRSVARHMSGLFMRMNPAWSDTRSLGAEDVRTFWEAAGDMYRDDRATFDKRIEELFPGYTVTDFVEPLVNNNTQIFEITDSDGIVRKASLLRVRQAWSESEGNVTRFAERLHALEGGKPGDEGRTIGSVLGTFRRMFGEIKSDQDSKNGTEALGLEILPRQMMDARVANDWPAEWVSYASYTKADNLTLLHQLARGAAFGPDAIAATGELGSTIREAKRDLDELYYRFDQMHREGLAPKEIERQMGADDYVIAKNALKISSNLDRVQQAFRAMSAHTNYLAGDFRLMNEALGFASTMMVQNPRGTAINTSDILGSLVALKVSRPALKAQARAIVTLAADLGNGVLQAFGQNAAFNVGAAKRRMVAGVRDPDLRVSWREKMNNFGPGLSLAAPSGYESPLAKTRRTLTRFAAKGRDIIPNLGSPLQGKSEMQTLSPKLRWGGFPNWAMSTMNANIDAAYEVFTDLATRGVSYLQKIPAADRAKFVRELELGVRDLDADQLGYFGGLILNDRAAFDSMRSALETKMAGESGVGRFVAKAFRRQEGSGGGEYEAISNSQFTDIVNYANTEWTLQNNFASLPPWMQSGPLRPLFIFLTWPYNAMRRFGKTFTDPEGRLIWWGANSTVADGMKAFFLLAAPATIAGSFAIDFYDKYILGKKQNLRNTSWTTALPVVGPITDPRAFVERVGRYSSAGFASELIAQMSSPEPIRNLSLDSRIVAVNALTNLLINIPSTIFNQEAITYNSVGRPFFQSIGGGGVLAYLQIANNVLDLNTQDAAINARINTGNYLRSAGRELNLPVRSFRGAGEAPTNSTPYLQQMELAALVNNPELFQAAYRSAVDGAREDGRANPEKYVADNFADRHPLRRLFKTSPTDAEYRRMQGLMGEYGSGQVRAAVNSFNRYLTNWFGKPAYYGKREKDGSSVEELIRQASRINAGESAGASLEIP